MTSLFGIKEAPQGYGRGVNFFPRKHFRLLSTFFQDPLSKLFRVVAGGWSGPGGGGAGGGRFIQTSPPHLCPPPSPYHGFPTGLCECSCSPPIYSTCARKIVENGDC